MSKMEDHGTSGSIGLNSLAARLEGVFHKWAQLEPLAPRPRFGLGPTGPDRGSPRFGVALGDEKDAVTIDPHFQSVMTAVLLREIICGYFPPACLVDITLDVINRFCGIFLASIDQGSSYPHDAPRWQALVKAHTRRYVVHYLGSPITLDLDAFPQGLAFFRGFRVFLGKLRQHAPLIPPGQADDIVAMIHRSTTNLLWEHAYAPEDAEFIALVADYMGTHAAFPTIKRLAGVQRPGWTLERCEAAAHRLGEDPLCPMYLPSPGAFGLVFCWVLLEAPPVVSSYLLRHLTFLPFASLGFSQCVGAPVPTYFSINLLPPAQLDEFVAFLAGLKRQGVLLDFQVFRAERSLDILNWNETLMVPSPAPVVSEIHVNYQAGRGQGTAGVPLSWTRQQLLPKFGVRQYTPWAVTHLDPVRNYGALPLAVEDAALLSSATLEKDLALVMPLLERYRNVEYVLRLLTLAADLLRHLFDHPEAAGRGPGEFGKLGLAWRYFPARDWLLGHFHASAGDAARQSAALETLSLAARVLQFFAPFTIPPATPATAYIREKQQALSDMIKAELAQIPAGEQERFQFYTSLHDSIVGDRLVVPRIGLSPQFHPSSEDFFFFARSSRPWEELAAGFAAQFSSQVHHLMLVQYHDQIGASVIGGIIRATHAQFRALRRGLVGPKGVLGPGASLLVGRRVPFWDIIRRNFVETYDLTARSYAPIKDYLALVRDELLAGWTRPSSASQPYARKVLAEPYLGPVEQVPRAPPNVMRLTPNLVADLKASFLSGTSALHNLVGRRLGARETCDLDWPAYGLERYFLHVFLSTRQPRYIFTHLITPATRRVLASSAVSGFQTVILEYLWPKGAPDDGFLRYLYSRTEKNVLAYSVHRVLSDTRFFNLDRVGQGQGEGTAWDNTDLLVLALARPPQAGRPQASEFTYGGDTRHGPGSAAWGMAADYFTGKMSVIKEPRDLPPDSRASFEFDPRTVGFTEKTALIFRGDFDALPLCQALPFGHYYRTEEVAYEGTTRLAGQPGHLILFDFPAMRAAQVDLFLDDLLRNPAVVSHSVASFLVDQKLALVGGVALARVHPLRANPYDFAAGQYIHLPKRQLRDGKWHTIPLRDQVSALNRAWSE